MTLAEAKPTPGEDASSSTVRTPESGLAGPLPPTPREEIDRAVAELSDHKGEWARLPVGERVILLDRLLDDLAAVAEPWVAAAQRKEGITEQPQFGGEEWLAGPYAVLRNIRLLRRSLGDLERHGRPRPPGPVRKVADDQIAVQVFPAEVWDSVFFPGVTAEVWMEPGIPEEGLADTQATAYRGDPGDGGVGLVLGAGNVSSIGPMDALYKLFVDNQVVLYKTHPVTEYLGPLLERAFSCLGDRGFFRVVYGGADEGAYLCRHEQVDEIHITGSDKTVEAIAFGPGAEGQRRKEAGEPPILNKPISSELGNVSPVLVVPGPWSRADIRYQAENLVSMLTNNAGFNCNATRVVVTYEGWDLREDFLAAVRDVLRQVPTRDAFYPGAAERCSRFAAPHPQAERFGVPADGQLPWVFIPGLDPTAEDDVCFREEAFCGLFTETALPAADEAAFVGEAVRFANDTLWGTLNITLLVHPASRKDPRVGPALDRAEAELRYGTISINHWAAIGYALGSTTWGAYPGHDLYDIQSGTGVVHNSFMFSRAQKSVVRSPFRVWPKPVWFVTQRTSRSLAQELTRFEADRSLTRLPALTWHALRG